MTQPWLMNCSHSGDGWCLECVKTEVDGLRSGLVDIILSCNDPAETHPDLVGDPNRWEVLVQRINSIAYKTLFPRPLVTEEVEKIFTPGKFPN